MDEKRFLVYVCANGESVEPKYQTQREAIALAEKMIATSKGDRLYVLECKPVAMVRFSPEFVKIERLAELA